MQPPKTQYARNGDVNIAYQVVGQGPIDLVVVPGFISHVDLWWTIPETTAFIRRLAAFSRLILFDKRGTGLSDPVAGLSTLEDRMEDLHAVLDAASSERTALLGISEGGPMSVLFAGTYPDRVTSLLLYGTFPTGKRGTGHFTPELEEKAETKAAELTALVDEHWGEGLAIEWGDAVGITSRPTSSRTRDRRLNGVGTRLAKQSPDAVPSLRVRTPSRPDAEASKQSTPLNRAGRTRHTRQVAG
jgi:pimeloyl-ACP methyl ester carboxylesterase